MTFSIHTKQFSNITKFFYNWQCLVYLFFNITYFKNSEKKIRSSSAILEQSSFKGIAKLQNSVYKKYQSILGLIKTFN